MGAIVIDLPALELATALLTAGAALTLVPHRRHLLGSTLELAVWFGFVLSSGLCIATFGNPKAQEATAAIAWGGIGLLRVQASFVLGILGGWIAAHRFVIANWVVIATGAEVFALAFAATLHEARRSAPRVHLVEWFEFPALAPRPAYVPAANPLAAIDRRLAGVTRAQLQSVKRTVETSPALASAAIGAAHILRPGHLRLMMVKLALRTEWRRENVAHATPSTTAPNIDSADGALGPAAGMKPLRQRRHRDAKVRTRMPAAQRRGVAGISTKEGGQSGVPGYRQRVAS